MTISPDIASLRATPLAIAALDVAVHLPARLREAGPRVHCITNTVAQGFTANVLLALGALPSMTIAPEEIADFAASADVLLVNLGTCDAERRRAIGRALDAATPRNRPWVLDPVLIDRSPGRAAFARELLARAPTAIRMNAAESRTLAASVNAAPVIAVSGAEDHARQGARHLCVSNGHALMAQVTAMGCAASAVMAACLVVERDALLAAAASLVLFGVAGELAAQGSHGPGSFAVAFLDALAALDTDTIRAQAQLREARDA